MAAEELQQRYPTGIGFKAGNYEVFETQLTTLNQFAKHGIIPNINYGKYKTQKCDALVIERTPVHRVVAIGETKPPGGVKASNWKKLAQDLIDTKMLPTKAQIGYVTDGTNTYWICGGAQSVVRISRQDNKALPVIINFNDPAFCAEFEYICANLDLSTGIVNTPQSVNPEALAKEIWQTVWRLQADRPEDCLATFVEVFIFKFLDDLQLLTTVNGIDVSFTNLVDNVPADQSFAYYEKNIRTHIKSLFPNGPDGYSIINGIVIQASNRDHNLIFHEILKKFKKFGSLRNTSPEFKSRLYESFLQESKTTTTFGQFFTPRKIVSSIHDMARVENLTAGQKICDPAAGVGGFVLEQMARDLSAQWQKQGSTITTIHDWSSLELVPKTAILAKANALVHCGEMLASQPSLIPSFAQWLNGAFQCKDKTSFGSLEDMSVDQYDLILTNPPFVVSGSADIGKLIKSNNARKTYFGQKCSGIEGLFIQFIVKALKANGNAWVILPETFFLRSTDRALRRWLFTHCKIDLLALLPERTFFNTPKRVVICHFSKRAKPLVVGVEKATLDKEKVLLYALSEIGETRDAKRLPISANDLPALVDAYKLHTVGAPISDPKSITVGASTLFNQDSLNIRHYWSQVQARALGLLGAEEDPVAIKTGIDATVKTLDEISEKWKKEGQSLTAPPAPFATKKIVIGAHCFIPGKGKNAITTPKPTDLFQIRIGKRVLKKEIHQNRSGVALYSANVRKPFGFVTTANAGGLPYGGALWSMDSDFDCRSVSAGETYSITDHCGEMKILVPGIDPAYLAAQIRQAGLDYGFNREFRPSLEMIGKLEVELPVDAAGAFDLDLMQRWTAYRMTLDLFRQQMAKLLEK